MTTRPRTRSSTPRTRSASGASSSPTAAGWCTSCTATTRRGPGSTRSRSCCRGRGSRSARSQRRLTVRGEGFRFNSRVTLYYHRAKRGTFKADADGKFIAHDPAALLRPPTATGWSRPTTSATTRPRWACEPTLRNRAGAPADRGAGSSRRGGTRPPSSRPGADAPAQPADGGARHAQGSARGRRAAREGAASRSRTAARTCRRRRPISSSRSSRATARRPCAGASG